MVINNHSFEEQVRRSLAEIQSELKSAEEERDKLSDRVIELTRIAHAYELVLEHQAKHSGKTQWIGVDWRKILHGKKREKQLLEIANRKDGKLKVSEATDILFTTGLIKSKKRQNAYAVIYGNLLEMVNKGLVEKIGSGEFGLVSHPISTFTKPPVSKLFE